MVVYCVRHGESAFNAQRRIQGQIDVPLSDLGRKQSEAVAETLAVLPIEAVYSSPLERALETARPIAAALKLQVRLDERLLELHAGIFQGKVWEEIEAEYPDEARRWKRDPEYVIPGGESRRSLMQRGRAALEAVREAGHRNAVVVSHGGVLTAAFKALLGIPPDRNPFSLYNASISKLLWEGEVKLMTLNQIDHLPRLGGQHMTRAGDL